MGEIQIWKIAEMLYLFEQATAWIAVLFALIPWELVRILGGRSSIRHLAERLGGGAAIEGNPIVIHAVSAGEVRAAEAIIRQLGGDRPIVVTAGNRAGREAAERLDSITAVRYLPWDVALLVARFIERNRPSIVVVMETEIWPALFRTCARMNVPIVMVNGRMSDGDAVRYRLIRPLIASTLGHASAILVSSSREKARFLESGAPERLITINGNVKVDLPRDDRALPKSLEKALGQARAGGLVLVAGSTHRGEEEILLSALRSIRNGRPRVRLVIAPRDVGRARALVRLAVANDFATVVSSVPSEPWNVMIIDRMGILQALYARSDIAIIGGSLLPYGGHNFLEAVVHATPVIAGPSMQHFEELASIFEKRGGLVRLASSDDLTEALGRLIDSEEARKEIGERAGEILESQRGAASRAARTITQLVK